MSAVRTIAASLVKVTAVAAAVAIAQPALGQADYGPKDAYYQGGNGQTSAVLRIPVTASVGGTCGFQNLENATFTVLNIDTTAWEREVGFVPECTAPWRIAVSSENGGLLQESGALPAGYRNKAPYTVSLQVAAD